jgi:hypothetical protein
MRVLVRLLVGLGGWAFPKWESLKMNPEKGGKFLEPEK